MKGQKNAYYCGECSRYTVTIDVDDGTTPYFFTCQFTKGCKGLAVSMMYPEEPWPDFVPKEPIIEWYKPTLAWARTQSRVMYLHVKAGGLNFRRVKDQ